MKKTFLLLFIFSMFLSNVMAQNDEIQPWDMFIGAKGGVNYSNLTVLGGDYKLGGVGGIFAEIYATKGFSINTELTYSRQGSKNVIRSEAEYPDSYGTYFYKLDYFNTNYLLVWHLTKNIGIYTGAHVGLVINAKSIFNNVETKIKKEIHRGDISIPVGLCFEVKNFVIDARYYQPIREIAKSPLAHQVLKNAKNRVFEVTLGYRIQFM
jgi:hypothetical protein